MVLGQAGAPSGALYPLEHGDALALCPSSHRPQCSQRARLAGSWDVLPNTGIRPCWRPAQPGLASAPAHCHHGGCVGWESGCKGSVFRCPAAPGKHWSICQQLGRARRCHSPRLGVSPGGSTGSETNSPCRMALRSKPQTGFIMVASCASSSPLHPAETKVLVVETSVCRAVGRDGILRLPWVQLGILCPPPDAHPSPV